jgi:hypothetical protein
MPDHYRMKWNAAGIDWTLHNPSGPVGRDLGNRGNRVLRGAKKLVGKDTRALEESLHVSQYRSSMGQYVTVGSDAKLAPHGLAHHEGTRPHIITPTGARGQYLIFRSSKTGGVVYATSVEHPGTKPNRYLTNALYLAL